ncbi:hypothetical protein [Granulicella aggregans]|jgi:hypothetical protein|uniref:hypothetical protein n=1 Tax=Granulicella aggregans TaxID=474949 RepID=UPI0021DFB89B|nr:hypothetical protein [Granulicella aggregans]
MSTQDGDLDRLQAEYKAAVDLWVGAIREEEAHASVNHSIAEVDTWEQDAFREDDLRKQVRAAKSAYEGALRERFFNFK